MTTKSKAQQEKHKMSEIDENISKLFDIKKRLGKGAYGIVWKALDKRTNETLAVKKIFDAFRDETDAQRTFREIVFLKAFRNHPNVIKLHTVYKAANNLDIYLIFEYMESDLHNIIKKGSILKDIHKRYVMYQLINAIKYIHSGNVIHRDLKPSNVLIDSKCRCKLADFGLARSVSNRPIRDNNEMSSDPIVEPLLTDYVATRWYRAPEILVASKRYTKGIDMWSLGCILGEMIRGKPLFQGSSTVNQIEKIVTALPEITDHDINAVGAGFGSVLLSKQISRERKTSLDELLSDAPDDAINMVKSLLVLDPLARLTAKQALGHSYVEKFRNSIPEIELNVDILPPFRDDVRLTVPEYRSKLYEIVQINGDRTDKRHSLGTTKNTSRYKDHKHHVPYEKIEPTIKKSHKVKHNTEEKYICKEKYLSRPEKHEIETQPSVSVPSITGKPLKKTSMSPVPKRKSSKSQTRGNHAVNDQRSSALQPPDERASYTLNKSKNHIRPNEPLDEQLHGHYYDKRHSIDCGYGSLPDGGKHLMSPNTLKKLESPRRLHRSSSALHRGEQRNQHTQHYQQSRERPYASTQQQPVPVHHVPNDKQSEQTVEGNERFNRSTPVVSSLNQKPVYVRSTKSDLLANNAPSTANNKSNERICYEKRLKKLEEEIEKYKKEVKSFCKETFSYTYQQSPHDTHKQHNSHNHSNGQNLNQSQNHNHSQNKNHSQGYSQSNTRSHTPTRSNRQQQQQHRQEQQQYLPQQHSRSRHTSSSKSQQQHNTSSLPVMMAPPAGTGGDGIPQKNPYFHMLAKATRDYAKGEYLKGDYAHIHGDSGGDRPNDHAYNTHNSLSLDLDNHERKHQHHHSHSHHHQQHQHHHQQQQQQQQQHVHNQQHHQQRNRPVSKFLSRPQLGDHNTKASITNYQ